MVAQKKTKASKFLTVPTRPVPIDRDRSVAGLLEKMEGAGFGAKQLAEAHRIWLDMLDDNSTIYLCGSGNLIPSGMRRLLAYVIKNRFVDVIVMSGTVLFQDIHETLGRNHYQAHASMDDDELEASDVVRIGDTLANSEEYQEADEWIGSVINQLDLSRAYSTREFLHLMGRELAEIAHEDGIMTAAFKSRIPVFCPDLVGSELSVGIARARFEKKSHFTFDTTQDTMEMMQIAQKHVIRASLRSAACAARIWSTWLKFRRTLRAQRRAGTNTRFPSLPIRFRSKPVRLHSAAITRASSANYYEEQQRPMYRAIRR